MSGAAPAREPVPLVVIGGYLGAGKTTLVNQLLRQASGRRIAVLVNDFGEVAIDADLIEGADGEVLSLAGGCVCCAFGADLAGALEAARDRVPAADVILIETSGVALPGAVASGASLTPGLAVAGVVVLADAETLPALAADRWVGDTIARQLAEADLVLLTKTDLAAPAALQAAMVLLARLAPGAPVIPASRGDVAAELVLGPRPGRPRAADPAPAPHAHFETGVRRFPGPVDTAALAAELTARGSPVVRAKGVVTDLDGGRKLIQIVGRRVEISPRPGRDSEPAGEVVWIAAPSAHHHP